MSSPDTVTGATRQLAAEGYDCSVVLRDGELCFIQAGHCCPVEQAVVEKMYRFEGPSDPGDEMIVFGLVDPGSGHRGVLASAFGSDADPEVIEGLKYLVSNVHLGPET